MSDSVHVSVTCHQKFEEITLHWVRESRWQTEFEVVWIRGVFPWGGRAWLPCLWEVFARLSDVTRGKKPSEEVTSYLDDFGRLRAYVFPISRAIMKGCPWDNLWESSGRVIVIKGVSEDSSVGLSGPL